MRFNATTNQELPPLAWYAEIYDSGVEINHGQFVEVGDGWIVEGVWDGDFSKGQFARTEAFWGSGLVVGASSIEIVPSVSITDRIFVGTRANSWFAANSLPVLLGRSGLRLKSNHSYLRESFVLKDGVFEYDPSFPVDGDAEVFQLFHQNAVIQSGSISRYPRSEIRTFDGFEDYYGRLSDTTKRLGDNLRSPNRSHRMRPLATVSSGYDSACTAEIARGAGAQEAFTVERSNSRFPAALRPRATSDSGARIARALGLEPVILTPPPSEREIHFWSASCVRPELALDCVANHLNDEVGVLFTGFFGDTAWDLHIDEYATDSELTWPNPSGLSLSEGRLAGGYINVALPFLFGRSLASLKTISASREMAAWSVGGDYDRPIPRRILENAGVPRSAFGARKKAIVSSATSPTNRKLRENFYFWLGEARGINPFAYRLREMATSTLYWLVAVFEIAGKHLYLRVNRTAPEQLWPDDLKPHVLMFHWAVDTLADRFSHCHGEPDANIDPSKS